MMYRLFRNAFLAAGLTVPLITGAATPLEKGTGPNDEVWATEQNGNLNGGLNTGHGSIVIYKASDMSVKTVIDTDGTDPRTCAAGQTPPNCAKYTRPHVVLFSHDYKYAFVVGTLSKTVGVFDAATKQLLQDFSVAPGTSPHTTFPTPDDKRMFAVGIGGSKPFMQEFVRDFNNASTPYSKGRFLDLTDIEGVAGLADNAADANAIRSATAVPKPMFAVCPGYSRDSKDLYIRLVNGGMLVFDIDKPKGSFFAISKVFDTSSFPINGCGLALNASGEKLYLDSGLEHRSDIHVMDLRPETDPASPRFGRARNVLIKTIHTSGDGMSSPPGVCQTQFNTACHDLHSMHFSASGKELWAYSRTQSNAVIVSTACEDGAEFCDEVKGVMSFGPGFKSPDLSNVNRGKDLVYVSTRGPDPQPTAAHPISGNDSPGITVIDISKQEIIGAFPLRQASPPCTYTVGPVGGFECDDPHGVAYRMDPPPTVVDYSRKPGGM